jgi:hypothetical protein
MMQENLMKIKGCREHCRICLLRREFRREIMCII